MQGKATVRQYVIEALVRIDAGFKNKASEIADKAFGALHMARLLNVISYDEYEAARLLVKAERDWRGVRNFNHTEKWIDQARDARKEFDRVWGV